LSEEPQNILDRTTSRSVPLVGESILNDIFMKYGTPTDSKMSRLETMYESRIRTLADQKRRNSNIRNKDLLLDCASDLFTEMVLAFNILLIGVISPKEHLKFFFGPTAYIDKHMLELPDLIEDRLRSMVLFGIDERKLARAFIKLIKQAYYSDVSGRQRF